jgi:hypothetical protein
VGGPQISRPYQALKQQAKLESRLPGEAGRTTTPSDVFNSVMFPMRIFNVKREDFLAFYHQRQADVYKNITAAKGVISRERAFAQAGKPVPESLRTSAEQARGDLRLLLGKLAQDTQTAMPLADLLYGGREAAQAVMLSELQNKGLDKNEIRAVMIGNPADLPGYRGAKWRPKQSVRQSLAEERAKAGGQ